MARRTEVNYDPIPPNTERDYADAPASLEYFEAMRWAEGYNAALATLHQQYVVIWSGGTEADLGVYPFYNRADADKKYDECIAATNDGESRVDLVAITIDNKTVELGTYIGGQSTFEPDDTDI